MPDAQWLLNVAPLRFQLLVQRTDTFLTLNRLILFHQFLPLGSKHQRKQASHLSLIPCFWSCSYWFFLGLDPASSLKYWQFLWHMSRSLGVTTITSLSFWVPQIELIPGFLSWLVSLELIAKGIKQLVLWLLRQKCFSYRSREPNIKI